jgi:hypothetical protein
MKKLLVLLTFGIAFFSTAQQLTFKKGAIVDGIGIKDTVSESFALFLPSSFEPTKKWPIIFVFDMQGRSRQALSMLTRAAEKNKYILAASNNVNDSLSLTENVLVSRRMFNTVLSLFPIQKERVYTAGFSGGARIATVIPTFINEVKGVISCGSSFFNMDVLSSKKPVHFISIVGVEDFNYPRVLRVKRRLDELKFPNQILIFDGGSNWPPLHYLSKAMEYLDLEAMGKNIVPKDSVFIGRSYDESMMETNNLVSENRSVEAYRMLNEIAEIYKPFQKTNYLNESIKALKRSATYKSQNRSQNAIFFKESLIKEDYDYYLEEDILTYNYNNLGWWNYQMGELAKHKKSSNTFERQMGIRLDSYLNALIEDNIDLTQLDEPVDEQSLNFLWMLKTITAPSDFSNYLKVISLNAKVEDYGTALFYLEELLKKGYKNTNELYTLENTALLRITPEFNALVAKYLKESRYKIIEE